MKLNTKEKNPWLNDVILGVAEGCRHATAIKLVGRWYGKGLTPPEVGLLLGMWNAYNQPPLPDAEIVSIYKSTTKWQKKIWGYIDD